jgi:hypothetical protein
MLSIFYLSVGLSLSGALAGFIYTTSLGFYKSPSRLLLWVAFLGFLHIGPSRARYTNNGYPKGIHMSLISRNGGSTIFLHIMVAHNLK